MEKAIEDIALVCIKDDCSSGVKDLNNAELVTSTNKNVLDNSNRHSLNFTKISATKKAKRIRFFRNGDKYYNGVVIAVTPERYRNFDSLISDLTRALISNVTLPNGVRIIYTMDGKKVQDINDLEDGKCYVVSGQGEVFKKVDYSSSTVKRGSSLSGLPSLPAITKQISTIPLCVKARIITLIRNGIKPRRIVRLLLNKRNSLSIDHVLESITEIIKLDSGAVRKVYSLSGHQITMLEQFFENDEIFIVYGLDKPSHNDFDLDFEESKFVQSFRKGQCSVRKYNEPMPKMPARKIDKKSSYANQSSTSSPSAFNFPISLKDNYIMGNIIGDGNFAVVRQCIHKPTGAYYALKIIDKCKCQGKEVMLAREVAILRRVSHPNIINLVAEHETNEHLFLVLELMKGGDLFDAITTATKFTENDACIMMRHLCYALSYLHSHQIVHRDVKPENLLVQMNADQIYCLKLADFGLAEIVQEPLFTICGTPTYVAPEILAVVGYGLKIDVWAAGVILYILLCGFPPFVSTDNKQEKLFEKILSGEFEFTSPYWDNISLSAKELISNMLQPQPELRFGAEDVLDHPWLSESFQQDRYQSTSNQHQNSGIDSISR